jgi:hypothetical protein
VCGLLESRTEGLLQGGVDGVGGYITRPILVRTVVDLERTDDVEDGVSSARTNDHIGKTERVAVADNEGE